MTILSLNSVDTRPSAKLVGGQPRISDRQILENPSTVRVQHRKKYRELEATITSEIGGKKFSDEIIDSSIRVIPDIEIDPVTHEVIATPINDALGYRYTRFGKQSNPNQKAIVFLNEDGSIHQLKNFGYTKGFPSERTGKYLARKADPGKSGDKPFLPSIPLEVAIAAAAKIGDDCKASLIAHLGNGGLFWDWIEDWTQIPVIVTEGCYKALAAINHGYIALSLFGVDCGKKAGMIKPELLPYVQGRTVYLGMDSEWKPKTRKAISMLGKALTNHAKATVKVATWDGSIGKGIDDLCVVNPDLFHGAIANAQDIDDWEMSQYLALDDLISLKLNCPNLSEAVKFLPTQKLIGIGSPKKTFKTELLSIWVADFLYRGGKVIVPVHREQLAKDLANRLGLEYRTERTKEGAVFGYCLCIDSLHPNANPSFNADDWQGCWVILDEADQVFWHTLHSDTCDYNRPAILSSFTQLVNVADKIIMASADLNGICFDYIQSLLEEPADIYLIVNDWQHQKRQCFTFNSPQELFLKLREYIQNGQKLMIHVGGQKPKSTWGTINLERLILGLFPNLKILRIDRNSVGELGHPAYGVMGDLNAVIPLYDIVIASPTLETGVSINVPHFDAVFCFASGSQTVDAVGQAVERVRADVPRYIWATERVFGQKIGSGSTNPLALMHREKSLQKLNQALSEADKFAEFNWGGKTKHLETWAKFAAYHNRGFNDYRKSIYQLLEANGFTLTHLAIEDEEKSNSARESAKLSAEMGHARYCEKVADAPIIEDPKEYQALKDKRAKTEAERLSVEATAIAKRYATDQIDFDLVDHDSDPAHYGQLRLHFYLTKGAGLVKERDQERIQSLAKDTGKVFTPDLNKSCITPKVALLSNYVRLQDWLDPDRILPGDDPGLKAWHEQMCKGARDIKKIANISIKSDPHAKGNSPIAVLNRFTKMLGLKYICVGKQATGDQSRLYRLQKLDPDGRMAIFDRWLNKVPDSLPCKESGSDLVQNVIGQDPYKYNIQNSDLVISKTVPVKTQSDFDLSDKLDPFQAFHIGQRVELWHDVLEQFVPSQIVGIIPGWMGFLKIKHLDKRGGDCLFDREKLFQGRLAIAGAEVSYA